MKPSRRILGWLVAAMMILLRATCRVRVMNDPRPALQAAGQAYAYSVLHAHQVSVAIRREPHTAAMVSRSADGELLIPAFNALRIRSIRGSNQQKGGDRGGRAALDELIEYVGHKRPVILAVDGPRGPRNKVRKGIAVLSQRSGAAVLNVVAIPTRRWIIGKVWDRLQIPQPFSRIDAYFADPISPRAGESAEEYRRRIEASLNELERQHDPAEAPSVETNLPSADESAA